MAFLPQRLPHIRSFIYCATILLVGADLLRRLHRSAVKMLQMSPRPQPPHVLIIGAGVAGLTLAQALRKHNIPFTIFERDPTPDYRGKGWGLTVHWALDSFLSLLPQDLVDRLPETYVNPDAVARGENGRFPFFNLRTGQLRWSVPPSRRIRVSRERLRKLLMDGLDIQWNKSLSRLSQPSDTSICAHFTDGSSAIGTQLIGCDGHRSKTRASMCAQVPSSSGGKPRSDNEKLPVRLLGVSVPYPSQLAGKIHDIDPFFLQGGDSETGCFLYFSFLDTPSNNKRVDRDTYECQIIISWPYKPDNPSPHYPLEVPVDNVEKLRLMKSMAREWTEPFRQIVQSIPDDVIVKSISLEDWVTPKKGSWDNFNGKVTVMGDAAHTMTMYRGEGGNNSLFDVFKFITNMLPVIRSAQAGDNSSEALKEACDAYEEELIARGGPAVMRSRQACLDAHNPAALNDKSPLVSKRAPYLADDSNDLLNQSIPLA